jgi:hypothetical protein
MRGVFNIRGMASINRLHVYRIQGIGEMRPSTLITMVNVHLVGRLYSVANASRGMHQYFFSKRSVDLLDFFSRFQSLPPPVEGEDGVENMSNKCK